MSRSLIFLFALLLAGLFIYPAFDNAFAKDCKPDNVEIFTIKVQECVSYTESSDLPYVSWIDKQTKSKISLALPDKFKKFCKNGKIKKG